MARVRRLEHKESLQQHWRRQVGNTRRRRLHRRSDRLGCTDCSTVTVPAPAPAPAPAVSPVTWHKGSGHLAGRDDHAAVLAAVSCKDVGMREDPGFSCAEELAECHSTDLEWRDEMRRACPKTCGLCGGTTTNPPPSNSKSPPSAKSPPPSTASPPDLERAVGKPTG